MVPGQYYVATQAYSIPQLCNLIENTPGAITLTNNTLTNLSQSYYNVSTINLSKTAWNVYNTVNNQTSGLQPFWDYVVLYPQLHGMLMGIFVFQL